MQNGGDQGVKQALGKAASFGPDVDISDYEVGNRDVEQIKELDKTSEDMKETMINVGVTTDNVNRDGTIIFINNGMSHCSNSAQEGVEMLSTKEALAKYDWLKDYSWKAVDPQKDKYTAKTYLEDSDGYFIRVNKGYHAKHPVQTCMLL